MPEIYMGDASVPDPRVNTLFRRCMAAYQARELDRHVVNTNPFRCFVLKG